MGRRSTGAATTGSLHTERIQEQLRREERRERYGDEGTIHAGPPELSTGSPRGPHSPPIPFSPFFDSSEPFSLSLSLSFACGATPPFLFVLFIYFFFSYFSGKVCRAEVEALPKWRGAQRRSRESRLHRLCACTLPLPHLSRPPPLSLTSRGN